MAPGGRAVSPSRCSEDSQRSRQPTDFSCKSACLWPQRSPKARYRRFSQSWAFLPRRLVCSPSMSTSIQTPEAPESRRTVDALAMTLFVVVRGLPAAERRVLLSAIDGRLHGVGGERARLALEVLRRCERETQQTVSKRRYERWRENHPERMNLPSSTYVANSLGWSWARAMDATGVAPAVEQQ